VLGYLAGRGLGRAVGGCPLLGSCDEPIPILFAIPVAILGMGAGAALAASRVRRWWEGVVVFAAGIAAMLVLVALIGLLGVDGPVARGLAVGWLLAAAAVIAATGRRASRLYDRDAEYERPEPNREVSHNDGSHHTP
jgi:hypothetical protein